MESDNGSTFTQVDFRPAKRPKFFRKPSVTKDGSTSVTIPILSTNTLANASEDKGKAGRPVEQEEAEGTTTLDLLQIAQSRRPKRRGGIGFAPADSSDRLSSSISRAHGESRNLSNQDDVNHAAAIQSELETVTNRFTYSTGQVVDVDKHMLAYINSKMKTATNSQSATLSQLSNSSGPSVKSDQVALSINDSRAPTLGKLQEVDLGPESASINATRTAELLRQKEESGTPLSAAELYALAQAKKALEPEEPPRRWKKGEKRPKGWRKRRNSEDVARDLLVEEVLRESALGTNVYDPLAPGPSDARAGGNGDYEGSTDDRLAEAFKQEFLESMASRRRKGATTGVKKAGTASGAGVQEKRGPKLGGSRAARAAMRESEKKAASSTAGLGR